MKKMMFLMLTLLIMGAASMNAQVQIGGTNGPDKSAILDLNPDAGDAKGGLALPRVELTDSTQNLNGVEPQPGTVVYNTGSAKLAAGAYVWTPVAAGVGSAFTGVSVNNTGANTTIDGTGTPSSPLTVNVNAKGIKTAQLDDNAVTNAKIAAHTIALNKIATTKNDSSKVLISNGTDVNFGPMGITRYDSLTTNVGTVLATQPNVTWKKIVDTTINVALHANSVAYYGFTGLKTGDICNEANNYRWGIILGSKNNVLEIYTLLGEHGYQPLTIQCFRAS